MRRILGITLAFFVSITISAQLKLPQVRYLEQQGWSIQHSVMSWDSLSVYFSAKAPGNNSYDLYRLQVEGWRWGQPKRIDELSTNANEYWPSVSSDQSMMFYVTNNADSSVLWRASFHNGRWTEPAPLIISGIDDSKPQIAEDNQMLIFQRRERKKKHDGHSNTFAATMIDDHEWTLPVQVDSIPKAQPVIALSGELVTKKTERPLAAGKVQVYNVMDGQLLQTATVHPMTGHWRVALQKDKHYRIALTAEGYSYHYIDIQTDSLTEREERYVGSIVLDDRLALTITTYDAETQMILGTRQQTLPLGKMHNLTLSHMGYDDALLEVNTARPMVFTHTELDIPMQPQKAMHHFRIFNAANNNPIDDATLRINGQPTAADTALRINQELTLQVVAPGFLFNDTLFSTGSNTNEQTIPVHLIPLQKGMVLQLRNIQFEYDSYELTESSNAELESLAQLLRMNPTLRIELSAHTDDRGSDKYNDRLSSLRGQAVGAWLQEHGLPAQRMETVGYGKRKPLVANDTEEHRALNRRVEITVLDY